MINPLTNWSINNQFNWIDYHGQSINILSITLQKLRIKIAEQQSIAIICNKAYFCLQIFAPISSSTILLIQHHRNVVKTVTILPILLQLIHQKLSNVWSINTHHQRVEWQSTLTNSTQTNSLQILDSILAQNYNNHLPVNH